MNALTFDWSAMVTATTANIDTAIIAATSKEKTTTLYKEALVEIGAYTTIEAMRNLVITELQNVSTTWTKCKVDGNHKNGFTGYQANLPVKANAEKGILASAGCPEAVTYNAFAHWTTKNCDSVTGALLTADDKTKINKDKKDSDTIKETAEIQARIDNAVNEAVTLATNNMIDKSELITLDKEICIAHLVSLGFIQTNKKGKIVLTEK